MTTPRTALARRSDADPPPRRPVRSPDGGGGFGALTPERARVLMVVAARASGVTVVVLFAVVLGTLFASGGGLTGTSGAIAASWLAVHQVPLVIGKTGIGLWPLLPTGLLLWTVMRDCANAAENDWAPRELGWIVGAAVGGPLLVTAVCLAVADDASAVVALQPPDTVAAFAWVIVLHSAAAIAGIGSRRSAELLPLLPKPLPHWVIPGARIGLRAMRRLLTVAAGLTVLSFLLHWSRIGDTYHAADGRIAGVLGLTLLSLAYLPNIVIDGVGVLLGGQVHIGPGSLGLFGVEGAPLPAVPVMAVVPSGPAAWWWLLFLAVPVGIGVLAGLECSREAGDRPSAPWATLTSAGVVAVVFALLAAMAGGELGTFGHIGVAVAATTAPAFVWLAVAGCVGLLSARWVPMRGAVAGAAATAATVAANENDDDYDDYGYDEADYDAGYDDAGYRDTAYHDDEFADGDGEYDDHDERDDEDDDPEWDDEDDYYDDTVDGELLDDDEFDDAGSYPPSGTDDIVDAEVVEGGEGDTSRL